MGTTMKLLATILAVAFSSPADFLINTRDTQCTNKGGQCLDWRYYVCTAGYSSGLCNGDNNRKCCNKCDNSCVSQENQDKRGDGKCDDMGGKCMHNTNYCTDSWHSGKCGGDSARQCCAKGGSSGGSGKCNLQTYSSTYVKGYNGLKVQVDKGFKGHMDTIGKYAQQCSVTVYVTHAFRKEGQEIGGTVVPPASHSNHLVGHAIDMNLDTPIGWCNGDCLLAAYLNPSYNSYANNFIKQVQSQGMRWGGVFAPTDPVHIDDGLNVYNDSEWEDLYIYIQPLCQNI